MITPEQIINGYLNGYFPMANGRGKIEWYTCNPRAIFEIDKVKMPRSVKQSIRKYNYEMFADVNFEAVIRECSKREDTWINNEIIQMYTHLHQIGFAHSIETYCNGELVGGLYGVAIAGAFFGESMFHKKTDASKAAFYFLVEHLRNKGFTLLDTQYTCDHTINLGAVEIPDYVYFERLDEAIALNCRF